jgi:hypothetical protein
MRRLELEIFVPAPDWPPFEQVARELFELPAGAYESCLDDRISGERLAEIFCERGLLTRGQASAVLRAQAEWIADCLRADSDGECGFPIPALLSVCLPAYNEEANIPGMLQAASAILPEFVEDFEVIVVDDGSSDRTAERAGRYARDDARVRLIRHDRNRGYGASLSTAFRAARGDLVFFTDADGQFSLLDLGLLLKSVRKSDVVIGYRHPRADHSGRLLNAWAWNRLIRLLLGVRVRDLDCAFKLFRREIVEQLELTATGSCINAEIMVQCARRGWIVREVPVHHYPRAGGVATGAAPGVICRALRELPGLLRYRTSCKAAPGKAGMRKDLSACPRPMDYPERLPAIGLEP